MERRNENSIGVTEAGIKKNPAAFRQQDAHDYTHKHEKLGSYFFLFFHISFCSFTDHNVPET